MRNDWPMGYDEECLEPACEIFLQLFLQNAQAAINDNPVDDQENEEIPFQEDAEEAQVEEGPEMDDYFSPENDDEEEDDEEYDESQDNDGNDSQDNDGNDSQDNDGNDSQEHDDYDADDGEEHEGSITTITLSSDSDFSSETVFDPHQCNYEQPGHVSSSSSSSSATDFSSETIFDSHQCPDEQPEDASSSSTNDSAESTDLELQDGLQLRSSQEFHGYLRINREKSNIDEHCNQNPPNEMSHFSEESWNFADVSCEESQLNEESDAFQDSDVSSSIYNHQSDNSNDACSHVANKENCKTDAIPSSDLILSSKVEQSEACKVETATSNNASLSRHLSLYVVLPPKSFPSQSDNCLLSGASSDEKNSDVRPISSSSSLASSSTVLTDTDVNHLDSEPTQNSCKISSNFHESTSNIPDISDETTFEEDNKKCQSVSEFHSASGIMTNVKDSKSEVSAGFNGVHPEFSMSENNLFQEMDMIVESNASEEVMSTVTVSSLKRKVCSPVEDNVVNKVPKFSSSDNSSDSFHKSSLDDSCKTSSDNSERSALSEQNLVPSSITDGNKILSLGNSIEETSTISEKQKK